MLPLDEVFSFPLPGLDESSGFASWAALPPLSVAEERRRRRRISNRESARRSRMRKQRHLEELRSQGAQLRFENRVLADHLVATVDRCRIFLADNDRLRAESAALRRRLSIVGCLLLRQNHLLSSPLPPSPPPPPPPPGSTVAAAWLLNRRLRC